MVLFEYRRSLEWEDQSCWDLEEPLDREAEPGQEVGSRTAVEHGADFEHIAVHWEEVEAAVGEEEELTAFLPLDQDPVAAAVAVVLSFIERY